MLLIKLKKWSTVLRIITLRLVAFLFFYFDRPMDVSRIEQARWNDMNFDSMKPVKIVEYLKWSNDNACGFRQGYCQAADCTHFNVRLITS